MAYNPVPDVQPDSSPGVVDQTPTPTDSPSVTPAGVTPALESEGGESGLDRPAMNLKAEMDRKLGRLERQLTDMYAVLSSLVPSAPPAATPVAPPASNDTELFDAVRAGDPSAIQVLIDRRLAQHAQVTARQNAVTAQLQVLYQKYPMLRDPAHPLTQAALQAKAALVASGYANDLVTDLEAIKLAITDQPTLAVSESAPMSGVRRSSAAPVVPVASRRGSPAPVPGSNPEPVSARARELAKRMHVKDPEGAMKRFLERNRTGVANVSPTVGSAVKEES